MESSSRFTQSVRPTISEDEGWPRVGYLAVREGGPLGEWVMREVEISRQKSDLRVIAIHMSSAALGVTRTEALRIAWWLVKAVFAP